MMTAKDLETISNACGAAGYTPVGVDARAIAIDGCNYVKANSSPAGEESLWDEALAACEIVEAFMMRPLP